jgi:hypothetical protein
MYWDFEQLDPTSGAFFWPSFFSFFFFPFFFPPFPLRDGGREGLGEQELVDGV